MRKLIFLFCIMSAISFSLSYNTNFVERLKWKDTVYYYFDIDDETLVELVGKMVGEVNKYATSLSWVKITREESHDGRRFIVFRLNKYSCGRVLPIEDQLSLVEVSNQEGCHSGTNLRNLLIVLGFTETHRRLDRDDYITVEFDNIKPWCNEFYDKCYECLTSDNEAFKDYDFESVLHIPQYDDIRARNRALPVITPKKETSHLGERTIPHTISSKDSAIIGAIYG